MQKMLKTVKFTLFCGCLCFWGVIFTIPFTENTLQFLKMCTVTLSFMNNVSRNLYTKERVKIISLCFSETENEKEMQMKL